MDFYKWSEDGKRIIDPAGNPLTKDEVLSQMNRMYEALYACREVWVLMSEGMNVLDSIFFLGSSALTNEKVVDDGQVQLDEPAQGAAEGAQPT